MGDMLEATPEAGNIKIRSGITRRDPSPSAPKVFASGLIERWRSRGSHAIFSIAH
jgi:hypothetical protein